MSVLLSVEGVHKRFRGLAAVDGLSFEVRAGEIFAVIGPNGAGKTTLINVICGRLSPSAGRVLLDDRDITARSLHAISRMGVVRSFQQTNTFRSASVRENIARALRFSRAGAEGWQGLRALLDRLELTARLDEQSDKLPYGLQKMLGLMLAYATRPRVLMLDEPAAGLEGRERTRIDDLVRQALETLRCGILIVEHDMDLIRRLCGRILVLDAGRVLAEGPPAEVLSRRDVIDAYVGQAEAEG